LEQALNHGSQVVLRTDVNLMISMNSKASENIARRATAAFNAGRSDAARRLCEQGLSRQPGDPILHHLLAAVLFSEGEIASACTHIQSSLSKRPDHMAARLLAARIARAVKDFDGALSHLDRLIAAAPHREAFIEKARTLDQAGLQPAAREAWRAILAVIPDHPEATARLGRLAFDDGDPAAARRLLERAVAGQAPAAVWFDLGLVRQDLGDHAGAAAAYREALEIRPDYAEAALNLGTVLQDKGDLDGAMAAYRNAYRLRPTLFGTIAMALTSAPHGRLWLDEAALHRSLRG
jgi:tetratricopeptide (TPR) repeat protein